MPIRLRGHHLLCILSYTNKGYSDRFIDNFSHIVDRLAAGEEVLMVEGPDDLCGPMLAEENPHCLSPGVHERDAKAAASISTLLGRSVHPGVRLLLDPSVVERLREGFAGGTIRSACAGCEWQGLCSTVADAKFQEARFKTAG